MKFNGSDRLSGELYENDFQDRYSWLNTLIPDFSINNTRYNVMKVSYGIGSTKIIKKGLYYRIQLDINHFMAPLLRIRNLDNKSYSNAKDYAYSYSQFLFLKRERLFDFNIGLGYLF